MRSFNTYDNLLKLSLIDEVPVKVIEEVQEFDISDLLLENAQLSNTEQMYADILHLVRNWWGGDIPTPYQFSVAIAKLVTKAIIQYIPQMDYEGDRVAIDISQGYSLDALQDRFENTGYVLNRLKREGRWSWEDDEDEIRWFEDSYEGLMHPTKLPKWMFEGGDKSKKPELREDIFKWRRLSSDEGEETKDYLQGELIELYNDILSQKYDDGEYYEYIGHLADFLNDARKSKELAQKSGVPYAGSLEDIVNYFLKQPVEHRLVKIVKDYDKVLDSLREGDRDKMLQLYKDPNKVKLLKSYNDGYKMYQIISQDICGVTGEFMNHCVGGKDPLNPDSRILQLVGPNGDLHATIELSMSSDDFKPVNEVEQIKGKSNSKLKPEYAVMVRDFLAPFRSNPLTTWYRNHNGALSTFSAPVEQPNDYSYK